MIAEASSLRENADEPFQANGVDATTGSYSLPPLSASAIAALARGEKLDPEHSQEASRYCARLRAGTRELIDGRSHTLLEEAGWGVIFAEGTNPAIREALADLLEFRREQANRHENLYREFKGDTAYRRGQTKTQFLLTRGSGPGEIDPRVVPYYLLLIGGPAEIPYSFQYQLDMRYAVGRLCFETIDEYRLYARAVIAAENRLQHPQHKRDLALFGPVNPEDWCTEQASRVLVGALAERLAARNEPGWLVRPYRGPEATKPRLKSLLGGNEKPDVLLTATHGLWFTRDHVQQRSFQGALLCQEWPGPRWKGPVPPEWYLSAEDIGDEASVEGLITFHFACYSGGTPYFDDFDRRPVQHRSILASEPFIAALPQRLLAHPGGGALAVVAHVDQAWHHSFLWGRRPWLVTFEQMLARLLQGDPIGWAMEPFNRRYAELTSDLKDHLEQEEMGLSATRDDFTLADLWTATNDTRGFVVLGDPAVRLPRVAPEEAA